MKIVEGENRWQIKNDTDFSEIFQDLKNNVDTLMTDFISRQNEDSVFPNPGVYTYYKNYNNRVIWLSDEIYRESTVPIVKNILIWNYRKISETISSIKILTQ